MPAMKAVEGCSSVLKAFEAVAYGCFKLDQGDDDEVGQAALDVRPRPLDRVEIGRIRGQQEHRQPLALGIRSRMTRETWVFCRSQTRTIGSLRSW